MLRPQEISNHPELIRRMGLIAMNGMIEADIYGNVNSTHIMGSAIMNGIGGSGDFARNAYLSIFATPHWPRDGAISCIVPMASHVDHTEHDVQILVTEQGHADLRGTRPHSGRKSSLKNAPTPTSARPARLSGTRAQSALGQHTPHLLGEALSWHQKYVETGSMR